MKYGNLHPNRGNKRHFYQLARNETVCPPLGEVDIRCERFFYEGTSVVGCRLVREPPVRARTSASVNPL